MKKKTKELKVPMKFNPGLQKYEPKLPLKKGKEIEFKENWQLIKIMIIAILLFLLIYFITKKI